MRCVLELFDFYTAIELLIWHQIYLYIYIWLNSTQTIKFTFNLDGGYVSGESTFLSRITRISMHDWQPSFRR